MLFSRYSWVVTLRTVLTNASWTITDLCSFVAIFAFILSFNYRQCRHLFYSVLHFFFSTITFPENNIFCLVCFCSFWASRMKTFVFLACREHKTRKKFFFELVTFLLHLTVSLSQRSYSCLFQHIKLCMTIFTWMKSATRNFTTNSNMQIW